MNSHESPIEITMTDRDNRTVRELNFRPVWIKTSSDEPFGHNQGFRK
ncbi:hypothetical protein [Teredinibacter purpureus]|nr:hypothetical protein [Teredinibacter purpureus]